MIRMAALHCRQHGLHRRGNRSAQWFLMYVARFEMLDRDRPYVPLDFLPLRLTHFANTGASKDGELDRIRNGGVSGFPVTPILVAAEVGHKFRKVFVRQ